MTRDELEMEFRRLIGNHFPGQVPPDLVRALMLASGGYTATEVDRRARPDYRFAPKAQRGRESA